MALWRVWQHSTLPYQFILDSVKQRIEKLHKWLVTQRGVIQRTPIPYFVKILVQSCFGGNQLECCQNQRRYWNTKWFQFQVVRPNIHKLNQIWPYSEKWIDSLSDILGLSSFWDTPRNCLTYFNSGKLDSAKEEISVGRGWIAYDRNHSVSTLLHWGNYPKVSGDASCFGPPFF